MHLSKVPIWYITTVYTKALSTILIKYAGTSRRTVLSDGRDDSTKWLDRTSFFRVRCTSFHIHYTILTFFPCFIVLFQSCCSHAQVFGKTLLHEFPIFYSHTEWNLFSSGTNTLLWWRACFKKLNYKQTNKNMPRAHFDRKAYEVSITNKVSNIYININKFLPNTIIYVTR